MTKFRENLVIWPSKPKRHKNNGQMQIIKVLDGTDPIEFITTILNRIRFPTWFSVDFHGFFLTGEEELKFEFASRCTGIKFYDEEEDDLLLAEGEDNVKAEEFLKSMNINSLKNNWLDAHCMELGYGIESAFRPHRLLAAVLYFEPLTVTIEEVVGRD